MLAIQKNRNVSNSPYNPLMFEREARVLALLLDEGLCGFCAAAESC